MSKEPYRFTTIDNWQEKHSEILKEVMDNDSNYNEYEYQWSITRNEPHRPKDRNYPKKTASNPIDIFRLYLEMGLLPPPEILLVIDSMFETYFAHSGSITLEEVLFGELKKGVGNYAARKSKKDSDFLFWMFLTPKKGKEYKSEVERAEEFLQEWEIKFKERGRDIDLPDVDTFLRQVRRWKRGLADN